MSVYDDAIQAAALLYGEQEENLPRLCRAAVDSYTQRLKAGLTPEDCGNALATAAALVAVATVRSGNAVSDFSAAVVSVRFAEDSGRFIDAAERLMAPFLDASGLAFRSVRA